MRFREWLWSDVFGGTGRAIRIIAATALAVAVSVGAGYAGDISAQPNNGLSVTNSAANVMPDDQAAESGWLSGLHVSGYGSQTFGMWQNPTTLRDYTKSRNNLATSRTLLQVDENYRLNDANTFFMREWFVYEPPYSFNSANNKAYGAGTPFHSSFGEKMNDYYNNYQIRDAWWENKTGPLTTFVGNQIVVWGQSLAFRVGDVINPADTCWAFGFANLEQSRNAQWMVHPILNLPEWGHFSSNFLELVVQPGFSPVWWPEQSGDPYNKYRSDITAGRALPCLPAASHGPSARFDVHYDNRAIFGADAPLSAGPYGPSGAGLVAPPAARLFFICNPGIVRAGFNPYKAQMAHFDPHCNLLLSKNQHNYGPIGDNVNGANPVDTGFWHVPGMQPQNWNEGVRFHSLTGPAEWTLLYYNDNTGGASPWSLKWTPYTSLWNYTLPDIQEAGATVDSPLPVPSSIAEYFPAVGRGEMLYINHNSFETNVFNSMTGQRWSDVVKWMVAIDLDQAYAPWLTSTGNLSANVEVEDNIIMDNAKFSYVGNDLNEQNLKNDVSVLFNIGTSWWWEDFAPTWTMIYNPKGTTFALFPAIVLNPPWTKKYFLKLQAIEVLGGDREAGIGLFKGQSLLTAQFQYNFNLL
ncbi:MAG TPA: hypothetical protein VJN94_10155 [Candidatus Binataceae bacterium]|nr:hypothetical protein [Candidatus Binataceae bacterium]